MTHTPGPWRVENNTIFDGANIQIATAFFSVAMNIREYSSNIDLIAAAPDLLEALKDAREFVSAWKFNLDEIGSEDDEHLNETTSLLEKIEQAIAKAQ